MPRRPRASWCGTASTPSWCGTRSIPCPRPGSTRRRIWRPVHRSPWPRIARGRTRCARPGSASTRRRRSFSIPGCCNRFRTRGRSTRTAIPDAGFDWYLGVCPTHEGYLAAKIDRLRRVAAELEPDGLFLSFTRYPGFWENWVPGYAFTNADRFCFCPRCRARFARGPRDRAPSRRCRDPGARHPRRARRRLDRLARAADRRGRSTASPPRCAPSGPSIEIMLNTLAFPASDFDGLDVRREIAAQDLGMLRGSVDRFELMTYLQILDRPDSWLETVVADARRALPDRPLYCTLQVAPLYTEGIHAGGGGQRRSPPRSSTGRRGRRSTPGRTGWSSTTGPISWSTRPRAAASGPCCEGLPVPDAARDPSRSQLLRQPLPPPRAAGSAGDGVDRGELRRPRHVRSRPALEPRHHGRAGQDRP